MINSFSALDLKAIPNFPEDSIQVSFVVHEVDLSKLAVPENRVEVYGDDVREALEAEGVIISTEDWAYTAEFEIVLRVPRLTSLEDVLKLLSEKVTSIEVATGIPFSQETS